MIVCSWGWKESAPEGRTVTERERLAARAEADRYFRAVEVAHLKAAAANAKRYERIIAAAEARWPGARAVPRKAVAA